MSIIQYVYYFLSISLLFPSSSLQQRRLVGDCGASREIHLNCRAPSCRQHLEKAHRALGLPSLEETDPMSFFRSKTSFQMGPLHMTTRLPQVKFNHRSTAYKCAFQYKSYKEELLERKVNRTQMGFHYLSKQNIIQCHIDIYTVCMACMPMYTVRFGISMLTVHNAVVCTLSTH